MSRLFIILLCFCLALDASAQGIYNESDIGLQRLFIEANKYKLLSQYDKAVETYEKIIEKDPVNGPAYYDLARVQLAQEDYDQAAKSIKKAISFENRNVWYLLTAADIYEQADNCREQVNALSGVVRLKEDYDLYSRIFNAQLNCQNLSGALTTIETIEDLYGPDVNWLDQKVNILLSQDQGKTALNRVQQYVGKNPDNVEVLERLANVLFVLDKRKKGQEVLEQIIARDPQNEYAIYQLGVLESNDDSQSRSLIALVKDPRFDLDYKIKSLLPVIQSSNDQSIISELLLCADQLVEDYPQDAKSNALRGDIRMISGDTDEAIQSYQKTLELDKSNYAVWDQLLYAYMISSEFQKLIETSELAMDYYPNQSGPYLYQAVGQYETGGLEEAIEFIEEFRFISSDQVVLNDISYLIESKVANDTGHRKNAINILIEYTDANSVRNPNIYDYLGDLFLLNGDKVNAEKNWKKSMEFGGAEEVLRAKIQSI